MISQTLTLSTTDLQGSYGSTVTMKSVNNSPPANPGYSGGMVVIEAVFQETVTHNNPLLGGSTPPSILVQTTDPLTGQVINSLSRVPDSSQPQSISVINKYYPREMTIINNTGASFEYRVLSSVEEETEYLNNPSKFEGAIVPNGATLKDSLLPSCYRFLIKAASGATSSLRVDFQNYKFGGP